METVTPIASPSRVLGAALGAAIGLAAMVLLSVVARVTGLHESIPLAFAVGESGVFSPTEGFLPAWFVPPIATGLAGGLLARSAVARVRWAGSAMGFVTYLLAILLGATVLVAAVVGGAMSGPAVTSIVDIAIGWIVFVVIGAVVMTPLLAVCVVAGIAWAALLRRIAPDPGPAFDDAPGWWLPLMAVVAIGLGVLWFLWATFLQILVESQP
jgi:hypothetical protein